MVTMETIENSDIATDAISDGTQALQHDAYDVQEFDRAVETYQRLAVAVNRAGEELSTAPPLIRDLFWSFHKRAPRINESVTLKPAFAVNRQILEAIMSAAEWRQLREAGSTSSMNWPHKLWRNRSRISANARPDRAWRPDARNEPPRRLKNHSTRTMTNGTGPYGWRRGGGWQKPLKRPKRFRTRSRLSAEVIPRVTGEVECLVR